MVAELEAVAEALPRPNQVTEQTERSPSTPVSPLMSARSQRLLEALAGHINRVDARVVLKVVGARLGGDLDSLPVERLARIADELPFALKLFLPNPSHLDRCVAEASVLLAEWLQQNPSALEVEIRTEADVAQARRATWRLCREQGLPRGEQTRVTTTVVELARNIALYAGLGTLAVRFTAGDKTSVEVVAADLGPGINDLHAIQSGRFKSKTGLGLGLASVRRLMDELDIDTAPGGPTTITARRVVKNKGRNPTTT